MGVEQRARLDGPHVIVNNEALAANDTIAQVEPDDCAGWEYWGFQWYSTKNGEVLVEYSLDGVTYFTLDRVVVIGTKPLNKEYPARWRYYRMSYTDESSEESHVSGGTYRRNVGVG